MIKNLLETDLITEYIFLRPARKFGFRVSRPHADASTMTVLRESELYQQQT
jgi:hypothetical protein